MKKVFKCICALVVFLSIPAVAGLGIMSLWNEIVPTTCGFAEIDFWQSVGLFLIGQLLSGGSLITLFLIIGAFHAILHHHSDDWGSHWHNMTREQKLEFMERRRKAHLRFHNRNKSGENASE